MIEMMVGEEYVVNLSWPEPGFNKLMSSSRTTESTISFSPATSTANAEPNLVGVGVGVPAPNT